MSDADVEITKTIEGTEQVLNDGMKVRLDATYDPFEKWTEYYIVVYNDDETVSKALIYDDLDENACALKGQIIPYKKEKVLNIYNSLIK